MIRAGVVGHPVGHSKSPLIHNYWLDRYGVRARYDAFDVSPAGLAEFVKTAAEKGKVSLFYTYKRPELFQGLGVTTACLYMKNKSGEQIMTGSDGVYPSASKSWNQWKTDLEI